MENTPEGRVVSWFFWRFEEQMKMKKKMREGRRERNGMGEKPSCQDLQKHLMEGRKDCWNQDMEEEGNGEIGDGVMEEKGEVKERV